MPLSPDGRSSDQCPHLVFSLEEPFPINLFSTMTIAIPEKKKSTGANKVVY